MKERKPRGPKPIPLQERFWIKVDILGEDDCWEWLAGLNGKSGYGQFCPGRGILPKGAHRMAYTLATGEELNEFDFICHTCHNRKCCNPKHLYKGTAQSNMDDMIKAGRMWHPPKPKGIDNPLFKLTLSQLDEIRSRSKSGETGMSLARAFGVGRTTIGRIIHYENYGLEHKL